MGKKVKSEKPTELATVMGPGGISPERLRKIITDGELVKANFLAQASLREEWEERRKYNGGLED